MDPIPPPPIDPPQLPEQAGPGPGVPACDPLAVALANASLLSVGYVMLGMRRLAVGAGAVTVVLVAILALAAQSTWFQIVVLLWWVAVTAHGWYLAGGRLAGGRLRHSGPGTPVADSWLGGVRKQRYIALGVALPVLLAVSFLRVDAAGIEEDAAEAQRKGECSRALSALDGLWAGHEVADAPLAARAEDSTEACELLVKAERQADRDPLAAARTLKTYGAHPGALWEGADGRRAGLFRVQAAEELDTGLTGDTEALEAGFGHLSTLLGEFSGQEETVGNVLDGFLDGLPAEDACDTKAITDWLGQRPEGDDALDRAADVVPEIAPAAIVGCGDDLMADDTWDEARAEYEQLLDEYPDHDLAGKAERGVEQAGLAIELDKVRGLLQTTYSDEQPEYCDNPAPYHGAKPYRGNGPHRAMLFGKDHHKKKLPNSWLAEDPANAVLVICTGEPKFGSSVETCQYESDFAISGAQSVTFKNRKIPVRVYEVRTGKRVASHSVEIGGSTCPAVLHYESFISADTGPPSEVYVNSSDSDVRAAYESLIYR